MDLVLVAALSLALGVLLGVGFGAARAFRLAQQRSAAAGASAVLARIWPDALPERSAADIMAGVVRLYLGDELFTLPVLPIAASRDWVARLDEEWAVLGAAIEEASDDSGQILSFLTAHTDKLRSMLRSYDRTDVLPDDAWIEIHATDAQVLRASVEVWRAAHPLAAIAAEGASSRTDGSGLVPTSTSPTPTAGVPSTSRGA